MELVVISGPQIGATVSLTDPCVTGLIQCIGIPAGGIWGGAPDASGIIDTDALRPYSGSVEYDYVDATGSLCEDGSFYQLKEFIIFGVGAHGPYCGSAAEQSFAIVGPLGVGITVESNGVMEYEQISSNTAVVTFDPSAHPPGNYPFTVYGSAALYCPTTIADTVVVYPLPAVTLELFSDIFCDTALVEALDIEGQPAGGEYHIDGSTEPYTEIAPAGWASDMHELTYTYTDPLTGCSAGDTTTFIVTICTGVDHPAAAFAGLRIFPNPVAGGSVRISCPSNTALRLFDATGRVVWSMANAPPTYLLDVAAFDDGTYIIRADTNGPVQYTRLILQR